MKVISYIKRILPLLIIVSLLTSCEEDLTGVLNTGENVPPSAGLIADEGFVVGSAMIESESFFKVKLSASDGSASLKSVSIKEEGAIVDFSRLLINGSQPAANPILLFSPDTEGFIWEVEVMAHADEASRSYTFEVSDDSGLTSEDLVTITTMAQMPIAPTLEYQGNTSFNAAPGSIVSIPLNVVAGNRSLTHIAVSEGADFIEDLSRLSFGDDPFTANPHPLAQADQDGFEKKVFIRVSNQPGAHSYRVFVVDGNSDGAFVDIVVTTGTPTTLIEGILFNSAGDTGTGGLDLDDGTGLGSSDPEIEIKDEGIDSDLTLAQNWKQQITGANGAELKYVIAGQNGTVEGFNFDNVTLKEEIQAAFENGTQFNNMNDDGQLVSNQVNIGDVFSVHLADKYYLMVIREINVVTNGNADHYVIDIKQ